MNFGKRLRAYRVKLDMTQKDLARKARLSESTISRYETSTRLPNFQSIQRLAVALGVPVEQLLNEAA